MSQDNPVPKLDLAPKLKRPLSPWNPRDYLRLLYWSIFFPQAFAWYLKNWAGGDIAPTLINVRTRWRLRLHNQNRKNLLIQELILIFFCASISYCLSTFFEPKSEFLLSVFIASLIFGFLLNLTRNIGAGITGTLATGVAIVLRLSVSYYIGLNGIESLVLVVGYGLELDGVKHLSLNSLIEVAFSTTDILLILAEITAFGLAFSNVVLGITESVAFGFAFGLILGLIFYSIENLPLNLVFGLVLGLAFGISFGLVFPTTQFIGQRLFNRIWSSLISSVVFGAASGMAFGVLFNDTFSIIESILLGILSCMVSSAAFVTVSWNPINWIVSLIFDPLKSQNSAWRFSHVTLLPNIRIISQLQNWLQKDWAIGIHNVNQILEYTFQSSHVVPPIQRVLIKFFDEQAIYRVNQLIEGTNNWQLIRSLVKFNSRLPSFATVNGFWYLYKKQPENATEAFNIVRDLLYGEEVFILAETLASFQKAETPHSIANLTISNFPTENLLRSATWQTMNRLQKVVEDIKLIQHSASRNTKAYAFSLAIGELTEVIDNKDSIPEAERALIVDIAQTWKLSLERIGKDIGNVTITQPVTNPYVIGNPVEGSLFVGREDILRQLEELWITSNQLQSVVLFGHRRMGKTSILKNFVNCTGAEVKVIYINLQRLGAVSQGVAEVLMAISDEIAAVSAISPPNDDKFLQLPQRTFERYLKQVIAEMPYKGLIIALDEFEFIEELIQRGQIETTFMGYLRGLVQMNPTKVAFAFAGLHTLEEMAADYFEPFYASVISIPVSFLNKGATKTILANPIADTPPLSRGARGDRKTEEREFLLEYKPEASDLIYDLTSGQPYLVQLIGFQLVRSYNDYVFERGMTRDNTFTVKDVEAIIDRKFFQQGRYYFEGVWKQAAQGATGQQEIIKALASQPQGLNKDILTDITNLELKTIEVAITTLKRHDVIAEKNGNYYLIVELFRRWVVEFCQDAAKI